MLVVAFSSILLDRLLDVDQARPRPRPLDGGSTGRDWAVHQGKELSFTNLLDLDAALRLVLEFSEPAGVVIKHTNPCGVATGTSLEEAYVRAREVDPLSAFGGIVGLNREIDVDTARALTSTPSPLPPTGKSRIWPMLDFTMKSLPRYLLMVFAFAGDSTMTKFLAISY